MLSVTDEPSATEPRPAVSSRVPLVPAERSTQPVAVAFADTFGVVSARDRFPLTVNHQSLALFNEQPVGMLTLPLPMVTLAPERVRTDAMLTCPTWLSDALLTLSTVPPVLEASEIVKHRLPLTVKPSPPKLPEVIQRRGDVDGDVASVMLPPRSLPLSVFPRNDSAPPLNVMLADESQGPEVWASFRERFAKIFNADDTGVKVSVVGPEAPSFHNVENMVEHSPTVWGVIAKLEGPLGPAGTVLGDDAPEPPAGPPRVPDITVADTGPDVAKSLLTVGT